MARRKETRVRNASDTPGVVKKAKLGRTKPLMVEAKTDGQVEYIESILSNDITICIGPAGSGKSLVAVGMALRLLDEHPDKYSKIIMVRPAVTVPGEDIGFLPGDSDEKMRPFMMPLIDSLRVFLDVSQILSIQHHGLIEVIPMAHMRGRTLNDAIVIFDEAQNARWENMKLFLTRIGFNCKAIVEGDVTQSDLDDKHRHHNGLKLAADKLEGIDGVGIVRLEHKDIVRSPIVKRILSRLN